MYAPDLGYQTTGGFFFHLLPYMDHVNVYKAGFTDTTYNLSWNGDVPGSGLKVCATVIKPYTCSSYPGFGGNPTSQPLSSAAGAGN